MKSRGTSYGNSQLEYPNGHFENPRARLVGYGRSFKLVFSFTRFFVRTSHRLRIGCTRKAEL